MCRDSAVLYCGLSDSGRVKVIRGENTSILDARLDLHPYTDRLGWGGRDAGTLQLALALLCDALGSDRRALVVHEDFAADALAFLSPDSDWMLSRSFIERTATAIEACHDLNWIRSAGQYLEEAIK